jgi:NTE family protein
VHAQYWHNTVVINTGNISAVDFDIDMEKKESLREIGYKTAKEFIPIKLKNMLATAKVAEVSVSSDKSLL